MKLLISLLLTVAALYAAQYDLPANRVVPWEPGVTVGVVGGIPTDRSTTINVTASPYFASGSATATTGNITSGSPTLTVTSASTFVAGNGIRVGYQEVQELTVTGGASATHHIGVQLPGNASTSKTNYDIEVEAGETTAQIAAKIRAYTFPGWTTGGSGSVVQFTFYSPRALGATVSMTGNDSGATGTGSVTRAGAVAAFTSISNVVGNTITLSANASASITDGMVEHDDSVAVAAAVAAAVSANNGTIVYLPAGTYLLSSGIGSGTAGAGSNYTIRGAGSGQLTGEATTLIQFNPITESAAIRVGSNQNSSFGFTITGSPAKGDSSVTVNESIAAFTNGQVIRIGILNNLDETEIEAGAVPVVSVYGYQYVRQHVAKITAVNTGTKTVTFSPALPFDCPSGLVPLLAHNSSNAMAVGIEDIAVDCTNEFPNLYSSAGVVLEQASGCWIKNVKVTNVPQRHLEVNNTAHCEVRHCYTDRRNGLGGSNGAGLNYSTSGGGLIVDNIIRRQFPLVEVNSAATTTAFVYNYFIDSTVFGISGVAIDTNHAPHNSFQLYEGNIMPNIQCDGYFGSTSDDTVFRNWISSTNPGGLTLVSIILNRFTRNYNFVGNVLGTSGTVTGTASYGNPNFANGSSTGTAEPSVGDFWTDFDISGTVASSTTITAAKATNLYAGQYVGISYGTNGTTQAFAPILSGIGTTITISSGTLPSNGTAVRIWAGVGSALEGKGFQELDLDCEISSILKANYYALAAGGGSIPGGESIGSDTLADSLAYAAKPDFFGSLAWPPFNSASPNQSIQAIPAGYRYINGNEDYLNGNSTATVTNLNVGTIRLAP